MNQIKKNNLKTVLFTVAVLIVLNGIGSQFFHRFDLTKDHRYSLSPTSLKIIQDIKEPLIIDVFLKGEFPGEFKKLQTETQQLLEEFKAYNSNIVFQFVNPLENEEEKDTIMQSFMNRGLTPINVTLEDKGKQTQEVVFPWAIATYHGRSVKVPLLKNMMGASTAEKVVSSVQHLEYAFANAFNTVTKKEQKKVIVIKGNGELNDQYINNFIKSVKENYFIAPFPLDSITINPTAGLKYLKKYDLAIVAKPTKPFSDEQKQVLDQFIVNGGKIIWLVDQVNMEIDSLNNETGTNLAFPMDLNLNDMFFKYGFRLYPSIIKDLQASPIVLETGEPGSETQKIKLPWYYSPMVYPSQDTKHPISTNIDAIKFQFASPIETLKNNINKTILLQSSQYSKLVGTPTEVSLRMVSEELTPKDFIGYGNYPVAVLLEGKFHSVFENRVLPFEDPTYKNKGKNSKMIVISDGDVIKNELDKNGKDVELGLDQRTGFFYGNKEFLMNCVNYLLDDNGLINIRSKVVDLPILDKEKVYDNYTKSQIISVGLPIITLVVFGFLFTFLRKRKYSK
jgi:gliding-associated putative ABC transporter substrate-binding component GldG